MSAPRKLTLDHFIEMSSGDREPFTTEKWLIRSFPSFNGVSLDSVVGEAIGLPFPVIQEKSKSVAAAQIFFPAGITVNGLTIQFGENQRLDVIRYIEAWTANIRNPETGGYYVASNYKRNLLVDLYNVEGDVIGTAKIKNAWPQGVSQFELDGQVARSMIPVQFQCDGQKFEFSK